MSISYNKSVPVVFMVQEGTDAPRAATEEDFLKAGYVLASDAKTSPSVGADEKCGFLGEDYVLVELLTFPEYLGDVLGGTLGKAYEDAKNLFSVNDLKANVTDFFAPLFSEESGTKASPEKPAPAPAPEKPAPAPAPEKPAPAPAPEKAPKASESEFSGIFGPITGALYNDISEYFETSAGSTPAGKATSEKAPVNEEASAEPEFNEFEQTVIGKFEELGLGADAASAIRKSKEFSDFLVSKKPTAEQTKSFADMLKNGKPPFFN